MRLENENNLNPFSERIKGGLQRAFSKVVYSESANQEELPRVQDKDSWVTGSTDQDLSGKELLCPGALL